MSSKLFKTYRNGNVGRSCCSFWVLFVQCCEAALVVGCWVAAGQHHDVRPGGGGGYERFWLSLSTLG